MFKLFTAGETVQGYDVPVLNEREVRGGAGIMLILALIGFMNAWLVGVYGPLKIFVVAFFLEFFIRVVINPKYAPTFIISRLIVQNQEVEYVGGIQKRFAWILGLGLASFMLIHLVILDRVGIVNLVACLLCLIFLSFEAIFGICIGCWVYGKFRPEVVKLCPGGACKMKFKEDIQKTSWVQILVLVLTVLLVAGFPILGLI